MKKTIATHLTKCYSLAQIQRGGVPQFLVASEKQFPCMVLDEQGAPVETVWEGPGGVMTMDPLPGGEGAFLATHRFYSPNDSAQASIVLAEPGATGWQVRRIRALPFVHRFGILEREGNRYIVAATLKSAHAFKDDWTCPGRIWVGSLPEDLGSYGPDNELPLEPLESGLYRNHGFFKGEENGYQFALISADNGVYKVLPPAPGGQWSCTRILEAPASDIALADFDGDGIQELLVFSHFHGEGLTVYKPEAGSYSPVYTHSQPLPFLHAIGVCSYHGHPVAAIGHRKGDRDLLMLEYADGSYQLRVLDHDVGPANVLCIPQGSGMRILSANREIDEVAIYDIP